MDGGGMRSGPAHLLALPLACLSSDTMEDLRTKIHNQLRVDLHPRRQRGATRPALRSRARTSRPRSRSTPRPTGRPRASTCHGRRASVGDGVGMPVGRGISQVDAPGEIVVVPSGQASHGVSGSKSVSASPAVQLLQPATRPTLAGCPWCEQY